MKKTNILKIFMTLVLAFVISGAFAQFPASVGDYNSSATESPDIVTINKSMPYFVHPDLTFSPAYVPGTSLTANVNTTFTWSYTAPGTGTENETVSNNNYVEVAFDEVGTWTIQAVESAAACDGDPVTLSVNVINPPFARINETFAAELGLSNVFASDCTPVNAAVNVAFDNASEGFPYFLVPTVTTYNYDLNGAGDALINQTAVATPAGLEITATDAAPISMAAAGALIAAKDYTTVNSKITVYEFDLVKWNAKISRKSDYVNIRNNTLDDTDPVNYTYYTAATSLQPGADVTVARIIVYPKPVTGPIYHIDNTWGL